MEDDKHAVRRPPHVNLHEIDSEGDPFLNRGQSIFRSMARSPTMADPQHPLHGISLSPDL
jgi:hypothetical protein